MSRLGICKAAATTTSMDSDQRRKRKRFYRSYNYKYFSLRSLLLLCSSFLVFLLFISSDRSILRTPSFHPVVRTSSSLSLLSNHLIRDSFSTARTKLLPIRVESQILLPDHVLLLVSDGIDKTSGIECVYSNSNSQPAYSFDEYHEPKSIVRCPLNGNYSTVLSLRRKRNGEFVDGNLSRQVNHIDSVLSWDRLAYEAALDGNSILVFVKGLNLRPHVESNPARFRCRFGLQNRDRRFALTTNAITAAQEVVRCLVPRSIQNNTAKAEGLIASITRGDDLALPSVARIQNLNANSKKKMTMNPEKYELCACTMLWNQANPLREWITYHSWLGVERFFIYDNNSDDGIEDVIDELESKNYNVTRHSWPWLKSQEAGFSHCALRAKNECKWLGFFDVDEFFFFPGRAVSGKNQLQSLVSKFSSNNTIGEIRTDCHSFGPSGLSKHPLQGVTTGYTCRLQGSERHKSIVRLETLDLSLLNIVHHFKLKQGFRHVNVALNTAVINHYKYQAWEIFKAKFYRRVSSYVVDWQEDMNKGSKDRAPGLGTEAIEPPDWRRRFCEVWDTGLRDFVLANFADEGTGFLPWQRTLL